MRFRANNALPEDAQDSSGYPWRSRGAAIVSLWDYGHIKFWFERTPRILLEEAGFREILFNRVGRISVFAKSMIAVARK